MNKIKNKPFLKVAFDIDDCIASFFDSYHIKFNTAKNPRMLEDHIITKNVYNIRNDKSFWTEMSVLERPDFEPHIYATKRISPKHFTKEWLNKNNFPDKPVYQTIYQHGNKADIIKGRCDLLIDDSVSNVLKCHESGVPALLIDRPHNEWFGPQFRIYSLSEDEIRDAYNLLIGYEKIIYDFIK